MKFKVGDVVRMINDDRRLNWDYYNRQHFDRFFKFDGSVKVLAVKLKAPTKEEMISIGRCGQWEDDVFVFAKRFDFAKGQLGLPFGRF